MTIEIIRNREGYEIMRRVFMVAIICAFCLLTISGQSRAETSQKEISRVEKPAAQENVAAMQSAVASWEKNWSKSDPDYASKKDRVLDRLELMLKAAKIENKLPQTVEQAVVLAEKARKDVEAGAGVPVQQEPFRDSMNEYERREQNSSTTLEQKRLLAKKLYANDVEATKKWDQRIKEHEERKKWDDFKNAIFVAWLSGLPVFFIGIFLLVWAYVIRKHGILIGGSIGIAPPVILASVLSPLWPLMMLVAIFVSVFKNQYVQVIKGVYLHPFRENIPKIASNLSSTKGDSYEKNF